MSPQFVDFNADGHMDIIVGTFDGSVHVSYGTEKGFSEPTHVLDKDGEQIIINQWWNREARKWDTSNRCNPEGHDLKPGHLTSAIAFDWNGNGAYDLLLGDKKTGHLYLRINEGTAKEPAFATTNQVVMADGKPITVETGITTMRAADWDGNGLLDLVIGSFGGTFRQDDTGGGVFLFRNVGKKDAPEFAAPVTLIAPSPKGHTAAVRPDAGMHPDVFDWNGDGKPDLIVGGYSMWTPEARELSDEEVTELATVNAEMAKVNQRRAEINALARKAAEGIEDVTEARSKMAEVLAEHREEMNELNSLTRTLTARRSQLVPTGQRISYTWVYLNGALPAEAASGEAKGETAQRD
jgi:hypothetical protein